MKRAGETVVENETWHTSRKGKGRRQGHNEHLRVGRGIDPDAAQLPRLPRKQNHESSTSGGSDRGGAGWAWDGMMHRTYLKSMIYLDPDSGRKVPAS